MSPEHMEELIKEINAGQACVLVSIQDGIATCTALRSEEAGEDMTMNFAVVAAFEALAGLLLQEYGLSMVLKLLRDVVGVVNENNPVNSVH